MIHDCYTCRITIMYVRTTQNSFICKLNCTGQLCQVHSKVGSMNTRDYFRPQVSLKSPHVAVRTYLQKSPPSQIEASVDTDALQASGGPY